MVMRKKQVSFFGKLYDVVVDTDNVTAIVLSDPFDMPEGYVKSIPPASSFFVKVGDEGGEEWFIAIGSTVVKKQYIPACEDVLEIWHGAHDVRPLVVRTSWDWRFVAPYNADVFDWSKPPAGGA